MNIPGQELQASEPDLLQAIGRYYVLYELEQKRRLALAQAYLELKQKYDALLKLNAPDEVVVPEPS